jgi:hypothetical protein
MMIGRYLKIWGLLGIALLMQMHIYAQLQTDISKIKSDVAALMQEGNYYRAAEIIRPVLEKDSSDLGLVFRYANCKRHLLSYRSAERWFRYVSALDQELAYPSARFYLALMEKNNGKYRAAKTDFEVYLQIGKDSRLLDMARNEIESCNFAIEHCNDSTNIEIEHLPAPVNTEYSEFNPVPISSSELVFSRYRNVFQDTIEGVFSDAYISDILVSKQSELGWSPPKVFSKRFQDNVDFVANICFSRNKRTAYFSICSHLGGTVGNCGLYYSSFKKGKWSKAKRLNNDINVEGYSSTHPFLAELKDFDVLYFASNKPGGQGGMDLWYVVIKDGTFQKSTNLGGVINTQGSEMTPYYNVKTKTLYFSSDWHKGFGGFDIFSAQGGLAQWDNPKNMGLPVNSGSNDLYYISNSTGEEAWFSSNRPGSLHHKNAENCCSDIYFVRYEAQAEEPQDSAEVPVIARDTTEQKIQKLLPLTLYFHNDVPDPHSSSPTTDKNYEDLLEQYFKLKDKYKREYSRGLKGAKARQAEQDIDDFFTNYVGHGFTDLEQLAALLKQELEQGKNIRLKIRGYASPLNTSEYNLNLSKRRIASLVNYLKIYDNGYFLPYFNGTAENGGSISIYEDPLGDTQAAEFVSDNPNDKRNSVYSRAAAMERKIQIILYSSGNTLQEDISNKEFPELSMSGIRNLGMVKSGARKVVKLSFTNSGKSELQIKSIDTDADYISIQLKKQNYQPGENGIIYLLIQGDKLPAGTQKFKLNIKTNALNPEQRFEFNFRVED